MKTTRMSRRQVLKGLGVSAAAGVVGRPRLAAAQAKPVTLTYVNYSAGLDKPMWDSLIGEFGKANPGITIRYQPIPGESWGDYFDKLATMIAGGNPPDVSRVAIEGARLVVSRGLAQPLDDFMKGDADIDEYMKDVSPRLLEVFRVDGKTYEFPFDWNNMVMYYNTKMFEHEKLAAPRKEWTKDEFVTLADRLTKRAVSGEPEVFGFGFAVQYFSGTMPWMFANGTNILSDDWTKSNLRDPKVLEVLQFMQDLVWKHKVSPKPPASHTDIYSLMAAGKIAMAGGGRWPVLQMTKAGFYDFDVQYFPRWKEQVTEYGVGGFVILKSTKYPQEAWKWVEVPDDEALPRDPDPGRPGHSRPALGGGQPGHVRAAAEERPHLLRVDRGAERQAGAVAGDLQPDRGDVAPLPGPRARQRDGARRGSRGSGQGVHRHSREPVAGRALRGRGRCDPARRTAAAASAAAPRRHRAGCGSQGSCDPAGPADTPDAVRRGWPSPSWRRPSPASSCSCWARRWRRSRSVSSTTTS